MMTDRTAPVAGAIETLVAELEREHARLVDLRSDAERAEHTCQRLMTAVEAALSALPRPQRRPFYVRVMQLRNETRRMGRPPKDGRQRAVLDFIAERGEGTITNAQIRQHLSQLGLKATPQYISTALTSLREDGVVRRLSHGYWKINPASPRFHLARSRHLLATPDRHGP